LLARFLADAGKRAFIKNNMNLGIIAAGEGSRLQQEGLNQPKPLVRVLGETLIGRQIRLAQEEGVQKIYIIINERGIQVKEFIEKNFDTANIHFTIKSTPSSLHSFYELSKSIPQDQDIMLTTVDPIIKECDYHHYITAAKNHKNIDAYMAATLWVDDEKPLFIKTDNALNILSYIGNINDYQCISGGVYYFGPRVFPFIAPAIESGMSKMRSFQQHLIDSKLKLKAHIINKIVDVDHIGDIEKAENFLKK